MRRLLILLSLLVSTAALRAEQHVLLYPVRPLTIADRVELRARGIEVQKALTGGRYIARVADAALAAGDPRVVSIEAFTAEHKILHSARRVVGRGRTWTDVTVIFHKDISFDAARQAILAAGGALEDIFETSFGTLRRIEARIAPAGMQALAADDRVLAIAGRSKRKMVEQNLRAAQLSRADVVQAAPYGLTGAGQVVMVSELSPAQANHVEFGTRVTANGTDSVGDHATHVTGTIAASGVRPDAKGMAPNVTVHQYDVGGTAASHLNLLDDELPKFHPIANNTSLGFPLGWCTDCPEGAGFPVWQDDEEFYGAYEPGYGTPAYDDISAEHGTLLLFSSGNNGDYPALSEFGQHRHVDEDGDATSLMYCFSPNNSGTDCPAICNGGCEIVRHHTVTPFDTMSVTASAKNALAVGAVHTLGSTPEIAGFSSRGPAKDGRVKPDIVARGQSVLSTIPTNQYGRSDGTSMAAPVATGIAVLIAEQWQKTFGTRATPSELKAVILAGARDLGNPGPDYTYGFGLIDAKNSADLIIADGGTHNQIKTVSLANGGSNETRITVGAPQTLRVLVTWADPSVILLGNDSFNAKALVNDIDLTVIGPTGGTFRPYVLDKVNFTANAATGVNNTDNTELIEIANAPAGTYRVLLSGTRITEGPQSAVLVTNVSSVGITPCNDLQEPNDTAETAYGNVLSGQSVSGAICSPGDVDFLKFIATRFGPMSATITTADVPLRVTMTAANGQSASIDVPANSTDTVRLDYGSGSAQAPPLNVTLRIEPISAPAAGANAHYDVSLTFGQFVPPRRRAVR